MRPVLNVASAVAAFTAAGFWWNASRQPPPTFSLVSYGGALDQGLQDWVRSSARANQRAAVAAGIAAFLQAVAGVVR